MVETQLEEKDDLEVQHTTIWKRSHHVAVQKGQNPAVTNPACIVEQT